jgi:hypothetical protein
MTLEDSVQNCDRKHYGNPDRGDDGAVENCTAARANAGVNRECRRRQNSRPMAALRCWIPDTLRTRTRTRLSNLKSRPLRWPRRGDARYTFKVLHNGRVVHSKSDGNADTREI